MKHVLVFAILIAGCCDPPEPIPPVDAGPDIETIDDAGPNCIPVRWMYGDQRYCDECVCPGTSCAMKPLGVEVETVGVCGPDLQCSVQCTDPMWLETHGD